MSPIRHTVMGCVAMVYVLSGCASTVRDYAAVLASNTARLNTEIQRLTKAHAEIDASRDKLSQILELSTLRNENYNQRRLAHWTALKSDPNFKERYELFKLISSHGEVAQANDIAISALRAKILEARTDPKGSRADKLGEATEYLAALSVPRSLEGEVRFIASYAKSVQDGVKQASNDASTASASAKDKAKVASEILKRPTIEEKE